MCLVTVEDPYGVAMKWNTAIYLACGLLVAVLTISLDLSNSQRLIVMASGFIVLVLAEVVFKRCMNSKVIPREAALPAAASALERNVLHAYREPNN